MFKKIILIISIVVIEIVISYAVYGLYGIPIGLYKGHLVVYTSYSPDDFSGRTERIKIIRGIDKKECLEIDGWPTLAGIGVYIGCEPK